jgi:hypothetical protein
MTESTTSPGELHHDGWGRLVLTLPDGDVHVNVEPARAFPWSAPDTAVSLRDADGRELLLLQSLGELSPASRSAVERELAERDFVPVVTRIARSSGPWPPCVWQVETDRGPATVTIDSEDDVRRLDRHRVLIADTSGLRFLIPNVHRLDAASLRQLRRLL